MIERRVEKFLRGLRRIDASYCQQPRNGRADFQFLRKDADGLIVAAKAFPQERNRHTVMSQRKDAKTQRLDREALDRISKIIVTKAILVHRKLGPGLLESV